MKKKLLAILMSMAMIMTFMPAMAFAESEDGDGFNAWLKWTEVDIPGNTPVIIAETDFPEGAELSYSWKYRPSDAEPESEMTAIDVNSNVLEFTADSGYGKGQYLCSVTASVDGNVVTVDTDSCDYPEPGIAIADDELSIDQSVAIKITNGWPTKCVKFVPDEDGSYFFIPSSDADLQNIMCILFDARGVQIVCWETQLGGHVNPVDLAKNEVVYVSFFYETEDEDAGDTYDVTVSVERANDSGDEGEEDSESSFEFEGKQYFYNRALDDEYVKEVVKGEGLAISPFDAYTIWYRGEDDEDVTVTDPAELFGDDVSYEWTRLNDETGEWEQMTCKSAAYTKESADESDEGDYRCNVIYNDEVLLNLNARVVILYAVEINGETYTYSLDPEREYHVLGEEVTLNNGAQFRDSSGEFAEPSFTKIEWYRITEEDGAQKEVLVRGDGYDISQDGSLHIDKVTGQDYGDYICRMYYDDEKYIESFAELQMRLSDMIVDVGLSRLNGVGNHDIIYSRFTNATPGAKLTYQWYYRDKDTEDPSYNGPDEGNPIEGETSATIEPKYGSHYYHCDITASMKGYDVETTGSNMNYITEIPEKYLDPSNTNFADGTGGSINASLAFGEEESEYYTFQPAANKIYELTATCNSTITDPIDVAVDSFDRNGVREGDDDAEYTAECTIKQAGTAVSVLTFESGSAADTVYFAACIPEDGSGSADITFEITETGDVQVYHVVEFETDNNEIMPSQLVKHGEKLTPESEPGKEGCSFGGWFTDAGCTTAFDLDTAITTDIILYAKWTEDVGPVVEETGAQVSFADSISEEDKEAVSNVTASVQDENLVDAAKAAADEVKVTPEDGLEALKSKGLAGDDASAEDVSIVIQTYLDMEIQSVIREEGSDEIKSVTIEITPKVSVIAALNEANIEIGTNAVVVEEKSITVNKATIVEIRLPEAFADSNVVYVLHNGEEYEASPKDGEPATFVFSTNGFSPFVFSKEHTQESSTVINATAKVKAATLPLKTKQKVDAAANLELPAGVSVSSVSSSNTKVLTVSGTTLKGKKKGKAVVTCALSDGSTVSYTVKVQTGKVKAKITGVPKTLTLHVGETYQITADKGYVTCKDKLKYKSSKKKVAKVSKNGLVTAKKNGTAKITVRCGSKKKNIKVKVIP